MKHCPLGIFCFLWHCLAPFSWEYSRIATEKTVFFLRMTFVLRDGHQEKEDALDLPPTPSI